MKRFAGVTFDGVLAASDRDVAALSHPLFELAVSFPGAGDGSERAVLRVRPLAATHVAALERALGGAGRPRGVVDAIRDADAIVVTFAPDVSPLDTLVALIDAVLGSEPADERLPGLDAGATDDESLAARAGRLLGEPRLAASRLIETHLEPLLARGSP